MEVQLTSVFRRTGEALISALNGTGPRLIINRGGQGCFYSDQEIITSKGSVPISQIKTGDMVLTLNSEKQKEYRQVKNIFTYKNNKKCYAIKMKNGSVIKCTEDHKFLYEGVWMCIKDILSLHHGNMENNTRI